MHHEDFGGLDRDMKLLRAALKRRDMLRIALGAAVLPFLGCDDSPTDSGNETCTLIPQETAGPFPGDGSNGPNVLTQAGAVRSDIRSSFGGLTGIADGIALTVKLTIVSAANDCAVLPGYAVYLWHCDRLGRYSLYSAGVTNQNYLRGVQAANANGEVTFSTIFPGCYQGRWPHIHFEVYPSLAAATAVANKISTSQLALPQNVCSAVYATAGYESSVANLAQVSLATDMVFSDGSASQVATMDGSVNAGYTATLTVTV